MTLEEISRGIRITSRVHVIIHGGHQRTIQKGKHSFQRIHGHRVAIVSLTGCHHLPQLHKGNRCFQSTPFFQDLLFLIPRASHRHRSRGLSFPFFCRLFKRDIHRLPIHDNLLLFISIINQHHLLHPIHVPLQQEREIRGHHDGIYRPKLFFPDNLTQINLLPFPVFPSSRNPVRNTPRTRQHQRATRQHEYPSRQHFHPILLYYIILQTTRLSFPSALLPAGLWQ